MANWLDKIIAKPVAAPRRAQPPVPTAPAKPGLPVALSSRPEPATLPNAAIVYAVAASALFVIALFFMFSGHWFDSFIVLLPGICFLGFALHFLKHPQ